MRRYGHDRQPIPQDHARKAGRNRPRAAGVILGAALLALPLVVAASEPRPGFTLTTLDGASASYSIMIGSDGLPVIAYVGEDAPDSFEPLKVAHCEDLACTVATISEIAPGGGGDGKWIGGVSITIGPDGFPLISYLDAEGDLRVAHCADVPCSSATISSKLLTASNRGDRLSQTAITVGIDGFGLIATSDYAVRTLNVAHCEDADCSRVTVSIASWQANHFGAITIGSDGLGIMSYGASDGSLRTAHCQTVDCSAVTQGAIVDQTEGLHGYRSSITIGTDGLPLIAYESRALSGPDDELRVAHCMNVACTSSTRAVVVPATILQWKIAPSISIGADGLGVIAYGMVELNIAHCSNVACTAATNIAAVPQSLGRTGVYPSLTIGTDGLPIVVTYDAGLLKVAHLSDRFGLPYHRRR